MAFSRIKLFLDAIWLARVTAILNPTGSNFSWKTCDQLETSGFAGNQSKNGEIKHRVCGKRQTSDLSLRFAMEETRLI